MDLKEIPGALMGYDFVQEAEAAEERRQARVPIGEHSGAHLPHVEEPADPGLFNSLAQHIDTIRRRYTQTRYTLRVLVEACDADMMIGPELQAAMDLAKEVLGD